MRNDPMKTGQASCLKTGIFPTTQSGEACFRIELETPEFLNDLAGIGSGAYLDMRQADVPEYEDWRDANFVAEGPRSYACQEGQTYAEDELERIYELLSQEAENPLVRRLFDGPQSGFEDYMGWQTEA